MTDTSIQYDVCGDQEYNNATTIAGEEEVRWRRAVVTAAVATTPHQHQYEVITANNHRNSNSTPPTICINKQTTACVMITEQSRHRTDSPTSGRRTLFDPIMKQANDCKDHQNST